MSYSTVVYRPASRESYTQPIQSVPYAPDSFRPMHLTEHIYPVRGRSSSVLPATAPRIDATGAETTQDASKAQISGNRVIAHPPIRDARISFQAVHEAKRNGNPIHQQPRRTKLTGIALPQSRVCVDCGAAYQAVKSERCEACREKKRRDQSIVWMQTKRKTRKAQA